MQIGLGELLDIVVVGGRTGQSHLQPGTGNGGIDRPRQRVGPGGLQIGGHVQEDGLPRIGALEAGLAQGLDRGDALDRQDRGAQPLDFGEGRGRIDSPIGVVND